MTATEEHLIGLRTADIDQPIVESVSLVCGPSVGPELHSEIEPAWDSVSLVFEPLAEFPEASPANDEDEAEPQKVRNTLEMPTADQPKTNLRRDGEFEEEPVFDRYAMLDAGLSVPDPPDRRLDGQPSTIVEDCTPLLAAASAQNMSPAQEEIPPEQEPAQAADIAPTPQEDEYDLAGTEGHVSIEPAGAAEPAFGTFGDDLIREPHPDAILDDVMPMLDDLIQPAEEIETFPPAIFEAAGEDFESERTIIERLNEANSLIAEADLLAAPTSEEIAELADFARSAEYDVVQPEPDDAPGVETAAEDLPDDAEDLAADNLYSTDQPEPHRPYAQLFSQLRRRGQWQA